MSAELLDFLQREVAACTMVIDGLHGTNPDDSCVCLFDDGTTALDADNRRTNLSPIKPPPVQKWTRHTARIIAATWNSTHSDRVTVTPFRDALISYRATLTERYQ